MSSKRKFNTDKNYMSQHVRLLLIVALNYRARALINKKKLLEIKNYYK